MNKEPYEIKKYYAIALDPIHVGAGGTRLGRVDLPIIREPGTDLPKIPGTSLSGPARAYTALVTNKYSCAGRGGDGGEKHCGFVNPACPVCVPYGFSKGSGNSRQGLAQFFDAQILLFPVSSMVGPIWITSPMAVEGLGLGQTFKVNEDSYYPLRNQFLSKERLNFGWLMLDKDKDGQGNLNNEYLPKEIIEKSILVSNKYFSMIINNNLEVRTSVSIDPATGAAEEKMLFTYEAIPRGTVFKFDIVYNDGSTFKIDVDTSWVKNQVENGLKLFEVLGIGGMNTRGMGRMKVLNLDTNRGDSNGKKFG
ncbi:type III-B CRISPR module RAMP protein Cmr4 [Methanocella conradii]|uniref:type III-B CRISPR module RAMP protein Cmr4 n=1 Tax=Methanocella conradii TaxID=1175444 RepID=UPI0024B3BF2A|nr:type III-B CRISPR module RAMP protein Cmr4 [Methanocella conradii]MDI6895771.1 type III-B CRISPR module RAMP protein Cmr4 [Methanocella conradii]